MVRNRIVAGDTQDIPEDTILPAEFDGWSCRVAEADTAVVCDGEPGPVILREPAT